MGIANLAMATGNVGRPGVGEPLRGQNNVQGPATWAFPHELPGYRHVSDATTRALFESAWNVSIDPEPGLRIPNMFEAALDGSFKGIYIQGEDIVQSDPNTQHVKPPWRRWNAWWCRTSSSTKPPSGPMCSCRAPVSGEGRHLHQRRAPHLAGAQSDAALAGKADWEATLALADALGYPMHYSHPSEIMDEIARLTPSFHG
jgi:formate dehydrogenase major subunit